MAGNLLLAHNPGLKVGVWLMLVYSVFLSEYWASFGTQVNSSMGTF